MERGIFSYIIKNSLPQQVVVLALTVASLPFYYVSLDIPKQIVNKVFDTAPQEVPGEVTIFSIGFGRFTQMELLATLCGLFLLFVLFNGAFKYTINVYKGLLGERMLRRLRGQLFQRLLDFPASQYRNVTKGEMVSIVSAEVEPLGGFIGDALALPFYQGGLLLTALVFIFAQDVLMGVAVVALYPVQLAIIPRLQAKVNDLGRARVREVRHMSNQLAEEIDMAYEIRVSNTAELERGRFETRLGRIFDIRYQIYKKKFFIKFLNNFIAQLTPFFFFSIGGYLVLTDELSLGALVAVLAAYKDLAPPWKELIDYYQQQQDARIKYEQIVIRFDVPQEQFPVRARENQERSEEKRSGFSAGGLHVRDGSDEMLSSVSFAIPPGQHVAVTGPIGAGKRLLVRAMAGLMRPTEGSLHLDGSSVMEMPLSERAREVAFVSNEPAFFEGTVSENLLYGVRRPDGAAVSDDQQISVLASVKMDHDLLELGLKTYLDPVARSDVAQRILGIRTAVKEKFAQFAASEMIEPLDPALYNDNATIIENIVFGSARENAIADDRLVASKSFRRALSQSKLDTGLTYMGYDLAKEIAGLDLQADEVSAAIGDYVVEPDELAACRTIVADRPRDKALSLSRQNRHFLQHLVLKVDAVAHDQISLDGELKDRVLIARQEFGEHMTPDLAAVIELYDPETFNPALTIGENIVFGKVASNGSAAGRNFEALLEDVIAELGMIEDLRRIGLLFPVGVSGSRLSPSQREKLALARGLMKRTTWLIIDNGISELDRATQRDVIHGVREHRQDQGLIWSLQDPDLAGDFDLRIELERT